MKTKIAASILNADFLYLEQEIKKVQKAGIDLIHLDVMDGQFVPNLSFGVPILEAIRPIVKVPVFSHLMVAQPENIIDKFIPASDAVIFHIEATKKPKRCIKIIKNSKKLVGIALNPNTPIKKVEPYLNDIYEILIMSVYPGFGGQKFIPKTIEKVKRTKALIKKYNKPIVIAVDGGVSENNAKSLIDAGVDILVVGTAIFHSTNYAVTIRKLKNGLG